MCLAIPGLVEAIEEGADALARRATVVFGHVKRDVSLAYVPEANIGDYVIVHVGIAISVLDEEEAKRTLSYLSEFPAEADA